MPRLIWNASGSHIYETGVDRGVLYVPGLHGVAWNGLISVSENPTGGSPTPYYIDGVKHLNPPSSEEFEATVTAFTYPDEFFQCEGLAVPYSGLFATAQPRKSFGLTYRTNIGSDLDGNEHGYKLHLVYNALAEPTTRLNRSTSDAPEAINFSWKITTRAPAVPAGLKRTAHFVVDSRLCYPAALTVLENTLYGDTSHSARLPDPSEVFTIFANNSTFTVLDNADGSWTAIGGSFEVIDNGDGTFTINTPDAVMVDTDTYTLSSP